jgi:hypothetical protein
VTLKKELKIALTALGTFKHVSSTTLIPVRKFPAVILDSAEPKVEQAEDGDAVLTAVKFTVYVLVHIEKNKLEESWIDAAEEQLEALVDSVRTVFKEEHRGVSYSNELMDAVKIGDRDCLEWIFDAEFK